MTRVHIDRTSVVRKWEELQWTFPIKVKEKVEADDEWDNVFGDQDPVMWYQLADRVMATPLSGDISGNVRMAEKAR